MRLIEKCKICHKRGTSICCLVTASFSVCDNIECDKKIENIILEYQIKNGEMYYQDYQKKDKENINIPRSSGGTSVGYIRDKELHNHILIIGDRGPLIRVGFIDNDNCYEKSVTYSKLAEYNLHLPMIKLYDNNDNITPDIAKLYNDYKLYLYNYCVINNKATQLVTWSNISDGDNGMFSLLPKEIVEMIINYYFNPDLV